MPQYRLCTLYSGSGGNAAYLETPGARILIDAGKSARTLVSSLRSIGVEPDTLDAILITHEHTDHIKALEVFTRKYPTPVYILYRSALRFRDTQPRELCACLRIYSEAPFTASVGDVTILAFPTPHDSNASVGYRFAIHGEEGVTEIGYATDIGYVTPELRAGLCGCEAVVVESNHDVDMLMDGPYPYDLKLRIRSRRGHLANRDCAELCAELAGQGTKHFLLAHLSEENNDPDIALDEAFSALGGQAITLATASPNAVTMLVGDAHAPLPLPSHRRSDPADGSLPIDNPTSTPVAETASPPVNPTEPAAPKTAIPAVTPRAASVFTARERAEAARRTAEALAEQMYHMTLHPTEPTSTSQN